MNHIESTSAAVENIENLPVGRLVWAQLSGYPFWPAIICPPVNEDGDESHSKCAHVMFLADNMRTAWIGSSKSLLPFEGLQQYQEHREAVLKSKQIRKSDLLKARKVFKLNVNAAWKAALAEANALTDVAMEQRLDFIRKSSIEKWRRKTGNKKTAPVVSDVEKSTLKCLSGLAYSSTESSLATSKSFLATESSSLSDCMLKHGDERQIEHCGAITHIEYFLESMDSIEVVLTSNINELAITTPVNKVGKIATGKAEVKAYSVQSHTQKHQSSQLTGIHASGSRKLTKEDKQEVLYKYAVSEKPINYLLTELSKELVCQICLYPGLIWMCKCGGFYHRECSSKTREDAKNYWYSSHKKRMEGNRAIIDLTSNSDVTELSTLSSDSPAFECGICLHERPPQCIVCSATTGKLIQCSKKSCDCYYHIECLKHWPQHKVIHEDDIVKRLMCPRHVCQICIADNPHRNYASNIEGDKALIKCLLCPATYHRKTQCIPAGSELLSQSQMVCPRHRQTDKKSINMNWCFLCTNGGKLICCETCPASFHLDCLNAPESDDKYICEDCESGRLPLYGETVWAKYGHKWWPALLPNPHDVPKNVAKLKPGPNYICVWFFGTYDYGWVCQGYVYPYDENDSSLTMKRPRDRGYHAAVLEASKITKEIRMKQVERRVPRKPKYIKIKMNQSKRSVSIEVEENECICSPTDANPCGPENNCINYALSIECITTCPAKERCQNQRFAKRIYPKVDLKYFDLKGWGLIARENIACNTFIIEYVGDLIDSNEFTRRFNRALKDKADNSYIFSLGNGIYIDATIRGNEARFINHSCEPNCSAQKWTVGGQTRIGFFAITDIPINTELTIQYNWKTFDMGMNKCVCHCGTPSCSGYID